MRSPSGPFRAQLDAAVADLALQVNRDTVLQARAALIVEANRLRDVMNREELRMAVGLCGGDPVSPQAATGFNRRILAMIEGCRQYCDDLERAAHALNSTARSYGYTDEDIARSLSGQGS